MMMVVMMMMQNLTTAMTIMVTIINYGDGKYDDSDDSYIEH